jgi:putative proteasome-type protease
MKSNISVGPPINLMVYHRNSFVIRHQLKFKRGDVYLQKIRSTWEDYLRQAFEKMPQIEWDRDEDNEVEEIIGK